METTDHTMTFNKMMKAYQLKDTNRSIAALEDILEHIKPLIVINPTRSLPSASSSRPTNKLENDAKFLKDKQSLKRKPDKDFLESFISLQCKVCR